jgi:glycosyltransferase involved in cell wall biosynthesis
MRVKVLEALAAGKAVVATPLAAEGLDGAPLLLADGDEQIADAVASLLLDAQARVEVGRRSRQWAESALAWERTVAEYERLYRGLLRRCSRAG